MKKIFFSVLLLFLLLPSPLFGEKPGLPVFYLKYNGAVGSEENEDEEIEPAYNRHWASLRIKEEFSALLTANLLFKVYRKDYSLIDSDFTYFYCNPYFGLRFSDKWTWNIGCRVKWTWYDTPDTAGTDRDITGLLFSTDLVWRPVSPLKIIPRFQAGYDIYKNPERSRQNYTLGLRLEGRLKTFVLGCSYKALGRFALGGESAFTAKWTHEFGASVTWDPNKGRE